MESYECTNPEIGKKIAFYEAGKLSMAEEIEFEAHLLSCESCFKDLSEMAASVTALEGVVKTASRKKMEEDKGQSGLMYLRPRRIDGSLAKRKQESYLLAAKGKEELPRMILAGEFESIEKDIHLRILKNDATGEIAGYLLSEDQDITKDVLIEIEGIEARYLPDEQGYFPIGKNLPFDFERIGIRLHTPIVSFNLGPRERTIGEEGTESRIPLVSHKHDRIVLSVSEGETGKLIRIEIEKIQSAGDIDNFHVVIRKEDGYTCLGKTERGIAVFEGLSGERRLEINIFE